jgi:hypothetical protein
MMERKKGRKEGKKGRKKQNADVVYRVNMASADVVYRVTMGDCFVDVAVLTLAQPSDGCAKHILALQNSLWICTAYNRSLLRLVTYKW